MHATFPSKVAGLLLAGTLGLLGPRSHAQTRVAEWVATTATAAWVAQPLPKTSASAGPADAELHLTQPQQTITGFGACFNELGWTSLSALGAGRGSQFHHLPDAHWGQRLFARLVLV
jgi:glucosylceramidase